MSYPEGCAGGFAAAPELSEAERRRLLELARAAVELAARERRALVPAPETSPGLSQHRAVFVTLHKEGLLRGCIGQIAVRRPLYWAVAEVAFSAALEDPRFPPIEPAELPKISLEISVLSDFFTLRPEDIRVGAHGLLIVHEAGRGLLLPQVATHYNWDPQHFLEETCRKAGLRPDAWKHGATIQGFTAEVFGE